jgi:type I site-specific restriction-modification system R (restriction) subunit
MSEGTKEQKLDFYDRLSEDTRRNVFLELLNFATNYDDICYDDDENEFYWEKSGLRLGE